MKFLESEGFEIQRDIGQIRKYVGVFEKDRRKKPGFARLLNRLYQFYNNPDYSFKTIVQLFLINSCLVK
jgi:hypothetical protein